MHHFTNNFFRKKTAVRVLIMSVITVLLSVCTYVLSTKLMAYLLAEETASVLAAFEGTHVLSACVIGIVFCSGILSIPLFFHFRKKLLPSLGRAFLYLIGGIPLLCLLVPKKRRIHIFRDGLKAVKEAWTDDDDYDVTVVTEINPDGSSYSYTDYSAPGVFYEILLLPITLVLNVLLGIFLFVTNLLIAFFLPVISPALAALGGAFIAYGLYLATEATGSSLLLFCGCALQILLLVFFSIGIPVISLVRDK